MQNKTNVKVIDVDTDDVFIEEFNFYECINCSWRFIGDAERYGHNFNSETTEIFRFCPMCGKEIEGIAD